MFLIEPLTRPVLALCSTQGIEPLTDRINVQGSSASAQRLESASQGKDLQLPTVGTSELGLYTCLLMVLINQSQYTVSRTVLLQSDGTNNHQPLGGVVYTFKRK